MLTRIEQDQPEALAFHLDGRQIKACAGDTVAAALMLAGIRSVRTTPVSGAPRAPFCLMGSCFDCLVEIDGIPNRQACMVEVRAGMDVRLQVGAARLEVGA